LLGSDAVADRVSPSKLTIEALLVGLLFLAIGLFGIAYGARAWLPPLASRHGAGIDAMLDYLLVSVGALFLVGHLTLGFLIWRAARQQEVTHRLATRNAEWRLSAALGLLVVGIGETGVLTIGMPVWTEYFAARAPADAVFVEVIGQQFMWNVRYPGNDGLFGRTDPRLTDDTTNPIGLDRTDPAAADDVTLQNEIAVQVNRPVRVRLRSKDTIHSFFLPHLRVKQDAIPGMTPEIIFIPTRAGTFEIACTELCGLGHYRMQGFLHVLSADEFRGWLQKQRQNPS
jgi:cytochrome c oxidase subunit 2